MSSVRVRYLDRDRTLAAVREAAAGIGRAHPEVLEIRLFGSLARGERNPYADADLLIVLERSDLPFHDRPPKYKPASAPVPTDFVVCTRAELEREVAAGNSSVQRILAESQILFSRQGAAAKL